MLIAFCGKAHAGKSTIAKLVQEQSGCVIYSMASPIRRFLYHLFMWDTEHFNGHLKEVAVVTPFVNMNDILLAIKDAGIPIEPYTTLKRFKDVFNTFAVEVAVFDGAPSTQYVISPRTAMQLFGTEVCRSINENIWLDCAAEAYKQSGYSMIIDDARFHNEFTWIFDNCGRIYHIVGRGGAVGTAHSSEQLNPADYPVTEFDNSGDMNKVFAFVQEVCNTMVVTVDKDA
jgi:hypothetical protein